MDIDNDEKLDMEIHQKLTENTNGKAAPASLLMNGQTARLKSVNTKKKKSFFRISNSFRIIIWLYIFSMIYCPSTTNLLTQDTPKFCKAYYQITNLVGPSIQPYFETYASPYFEPIWPYYKTIEKKVIRPASVLAREYGNPLIAKIKSLCRAYWLKYVLAQIQKYYETSHQYYRQRLGPYVDSKYNALNPYYFKFKIFILTINSDFILPYYDAYRPKIVNGCFVAHDITLKTIYPSVKWALINGKHFLNRNIGPKLKLLYSEKVEPQLIKIRERLNRYRDARNVKSTSSDMKSTSRHSTLQTSLTSLSIANSITTTPTSPNSYSNTPKSIAEGELSVHKKANNMVTQDIKEWQEKFSHAADEAADELDLRVTEIIDSFMLNELGNSGENHIEELKEAVKVGMENLKTNILSIIQKSNDTTEARQEIAIVVRKTGINVKEKAQILRSWKQTHHQNLNQIIDKTVSETLEILDTIQNIGMQEVGMRWAWSEGITYKHWAKYHAVKSKFVEWRQEVELVATEHPALKNALIKIDQIEVEALNIAENTAKELASLKEIGFKKLLDKDTSNDFATAGQQNAMNDDNHEKPSSEQDIKSVVHSTIKPNLNLITPSSQITKLMLTDSSFLPNIEEVVSPGPTIKSDTRDTSQEDKEPRAWALVPESDYTKETAIRESHGAFLSKSKSSDDIIINESSNKAMAGSKIIAPTGQHPLL